MKQTNIHTHIHKQETYKNTKSEIIEYKQKTSNKKKCSNKAIETKKIYKNTTEIILCWQSTVGHGAYT